LREDGEPDQEHQGVPDPDLGARVLKPLQG
jgi:hypothetical protein